MKKLTAQMKELVFKAMQEIEAAQKEVTAWEQKRNIYEKTYFNAQLDEKKANVAAVVGKWNSAILEAVEQYKSDARARNQLRGEDMTPDANLLSSGLPLSKEDLQAIFDRSKGNYTMQTLTMRYADQHKISLDGIFFTTEQTSEAADTMGKYARNALTRPEYRDIWDDSNQCEKIESPALI